MGLTPVPRNNIKLDSDLVKGIVTVGIHPALPIEGPRK